MLWARFTSSRVPEREAGATGAPTAEGEARPGAGSRPSVPQEPVVGAGVTFTLLDEERLPELRRAARRRSRLDELLAEAGDEVARIEDDTFYATSLAAYLVAEHDLPLLVLQETREVRALNRAYRGRVWLLTFADRERFLEPLASLEPSADRLRAFHEDLTEVEDARSGELMLAVYRGLCDALGRLRPGRVILVASGLF